MGGILAQLDSYLRFDGRLDARTGFVSGYDFLGGGSHDVVLGLAAAIAARVGPQEVVAVLINHSELAEPSDDSTRRALLCPMALTPETATCPFGSTAQAAEVPSFNAHFRPRPCATGSRQRHRRGGRPRLPRRHP